jgi:hypothetical protein
MPTATNPVYANVAFLRLPRFDARSVVEQASLKERLEARTREVLTALPADERVVLDTDDGLALILFGNPAQALAVAQAINADPDAAVQAGLNYGPLALTSRGSDARVFGDGLAAAAAAARFAEPGKLLVTQDFAKALAHRHPDRAKELATAGDFTDTRVRLHSFLTPDPRRGMMYRRRMLALGLGGVAVIVAGGYGGREVYKRLFPPPPALVRFQVKPRGEVFLDGVSKGRTPQLQQLEIPAGQHLIQIRSPGVPQFERTYDLKPGENRLIVHTFPELPKPKPQPPKQEPPDFWRDLKKKLS